MNTKGGLKIKYQGKDLDFTPPWPRVSMRNELKKAVGKDVYTLSLEQLVAVGKKYGISKQPSSGNIIIKLFDRLIGDKIVNPSHVIDHPKDATVMCYDITMAKEKRGEPGVLERFETFVNGMELTNCYSELNDPTKQKEAFDLFLQRSGRQLKMDEQFDHAIRMGMPPASGVGMGIDRLVMLIADKPDIHDVVSFSTYHEAK